jgi:hypothetical protein
MTPHARPESGFIADPLQLPIAPSFLIQPAEKFKCAFASTASAAGLWNDAVGQASRLSLNFQLRLRAFGSLLRRSHQMVKEVS